jgi:GTP-binding protein Era
VKLRRGVVTILGEPNAGKSTLLNALAGQKLAIVTHKPQTTRNRILGVAELPARKKAKGVASRPAAQVLLMDTPGVLAVHSGLDRRMLQEIHEALSQRDVVLLVVDASTKTPWDRAAKDEQKQHGSRPASRQAVLLDLLQHLEGTVFLVLNKVDLIDRERLLPMIAAWTERYKFDQVVPISATRKASLEALEDAIVAALPEGERYYPADQVTDQPERFLVSELIREKILLLTGQEIPYAAAVVVEQFIEPTEDEEKKAAKQGKKPLTRIAAAIFCERNSQKSILIGKQGAMLKKIGTEARHEIEQLLGTRVMLELFVKVEKDWRDSNKFLDDLDWRRQLEHLAAPHGFEES